MPLPVPQGEIAEAIAKENYTNYLRRETAALKREVDAKRIRQGLDPEYTDEK